MALVTGTIVGTGQVVTIELPTARVPELPDFVVIDDDDELAGYDTSENKTKGMKISQLRAKINGVATPEAPVVSGADMELTVPAELDGLKQWDIPALAGLNYSLERVGPSSSSRYMSDWFETLSTGGFELTRDFDVLYSGERWIAHIYEYEGGNSTVPSPGAGQSDKGFKLIDSTYPLVPDDVGYTFNISGGSNKPVITLLALADTPDKAELPFETMINNNFQSTIQTKNGEFIYFKGQALTKVYMGKGDTLKLKKAEDGWYVIDFFGNYLVAGQPIAGYSTMLNTLIADGSLVRKDSYPRLWEAVQAMGDALIEDTLWLSSVDYQGCYSLGPEDDPDVFRIPALDGTVLRFLNQGRSLDTNGRTHQFPGGYQADGVGNFLPDPNFDKLLAGSSGGNDTAATFAPGGRPPNWPQIDDSKSIVGLKSETTMKNTGVLGLILT
ncbi:hypothetical protein AAHN97_14960 [Chitinophaga niabensis]|uniref:hypothetical protein n=1 Tax=Chitinophaga niabensis TaxID=536979 RepID=UPI0031BB9859